MHSKIVHKHVERNENTVNCIEQLAVN